MLTNTDQQKIIQPPHARLSHSLHSHSPDSQCSKHSVVVLNYRHVPKKLFILSCHFWVWHSAFQWTFQVQNVHLCYATVVATVTPSRITQRQQIGKSQHESSQDENRAGEKEDVFSNNNVTCWYDRTPQCHQCSPTSCGHMCLANPEDRRNIWGVIIW